MFHAYKLGAKVAVAGGSFMGGMFLLAQSAVAFVSLCLSLSLSLSLYISVYLIDICSRCYGLEVI